MKEIGREELGGATRIERRKLDTVRQLNDLHATIARQQRANQRALPRAGRTGDFEDGWTPRSIHPNTGRRIPAHRHGDPYALDGLG